MKAEREKELRRAIFELAAFTAASARGCAVEPPLYGPLRLLEVISKLCDLERLVEDDEDSFLSRVKEDVDEEKFSVMTDEENFIRFLDDLAGRFGAELKKRRYKI